MIKINTIDENIKLSNNQIKKKDKIDEKYECVPYVWIYIVSEKIDKYIEDKLTNADGTIDVEQYEESIYPFLVSITNRNHIHVDDTPDGSAQQYSKTLVRGRYNIEKVDFIDDKVGQYSIKHLKHFYFNKRNVTLRLKNRLINEIDNTTSESLKKFKTSREMKLLNGDESMILKNMYVECIFRLDWAADMKDMPEWFYPCPKSPVEIARAIDIALGIAESKKFKPNVKKSSKSKFKVRNEFKDKINS